MPGQFSDYYNLRSPGPNIMRINVLYCRGNKGVRVMWEREEGRRGLRRETKVSSLHFWQDGTIVRTGVSDRWCRLDACVSIFNKDCCVCTRWRTRKVLYFYFKSKKIISFKICLFCTRKPKITLAALLCGFSLVLKPQENALSHNRKEIVCRKICFFPQYNRKDTFELWSEKLSRQIQLVFIFYAY